MRTTNAMTEVAVSAGFPGMLRVLSLCLVKNGGAFVLSATVHIAAVLPFASGLLRPEPSAAAPKLLEETLEVTLAEEFAADISEAVTPEQTAVLQPPVPDEAAFMTDALSPVTLPHPPPISTLPKLPTLPEVPCVPPTLPTVDTNPQKAPPIPQVSFPPAESKPTPVKRSLGATARVEGPRLATDASLVPKEYPKTARENGWQGTVVLEMTIDADSYLTDVRVIRSSGYKVLDKAARRAIRSARFTGGPGTIVQPITYKLSVPPT